MLTPALNRPPALGRFERPVGPQHEEIEMYEVGQTLFVRYRDERRGTGELAITKVGRKWLERVVIPHEPRT